MQEWKRSRGYQSLEQSTDQQRWRKDPVAFANDAFGISPWELQAIVMMAIAEDRRVAVRAGHKVGKSLLVALMAFWWVVCVPGGCCVITASSGRQVKLIDWREIRGLAVRAEKVGRLALPQAPLDPGTGIHWPDGRYIVGFSTDDAVNMGGFSGPAMLFLVDEASGVAEQIFEAIEGNLAGGTDDDETAQAKIVLLGNPTSTSGTFFDAFGKQRGIWRCFRIPSTASPNVKAGRVVVPGLATHEYVEGRLAAWGADDPRYQVRVEGNPPTQDPYSVVKLGAVEAAVERWRDDELHEQACRHGAHRLHIGLDVARFGDDDSVAAPRRGRVVLPLRSCHGLDEVAVSGMVIDLCYGPDGLHRQGERRPLVKVDVIGVGGGVATILRHATHEKTGDPLFEVVDVNVSEKALDEDSYPSKRDEMWFTLAEWLESEGAIPDDDELHGELIAPKYTFDGKGRRHVEPKADFKKRLGRSPDRAEALALSVYTPLNIDTASIYVPRKQLPGAYRFDGFGRGFG